MEEIRGSHPSFGLLRRICTLFLVMVVMPKHVNKSYRGRSKVAASMPFLSLFCFPGASVGRGFTGEQTAGAPGMGWNPHVPSLSCSPKGQPRPSVPVIAVEPACYHQSFTSLETYLGFRDVQVPMHISRVGQAMTHRRKITTWGAFCPIGHSCSLQPTSRPE